MWKPVLAAFAIWTVVVGCCFVFNETPMRASENEMAAAPPGPQPTSPPVEVPPASGAEPRVPLFHSQPAARSSRPAEVAPSPIGIQPEPSAGQQMEALDRHARVSMICYPGQFGRSDMPVIALDLKAIKP